jgi:hypothetical protein
MDVVPKLRSVHSFLARHRRITASVALVAMLGVLALQAHAALPEHHHQGEKATACIASLVEAALIVVALWKRHRAPTALPGWIGAVVPLVAVQPLTIPETCHAWTRAGPLEDSVLRL